MAESTPQWAQARAIRQERADERSLGARRSWASNSAQWAATARRLLTEPRDFGEPLLGFVALYLCVKTSESLVNGRSHVPADPEAASGCPFPGGELKALRDRLERIRDHVLHHADRFGEDGGIELQVLPHLTVRATRIVRGERTIDTMTSRSAIDLLDRLEPWLCSQNERLKEPPAPDLEAKVRAWARHASGSNSR